MNAVVKPTGLIYRLLLPTQERQRRSASRRERGLRLLIAGRLIFVYPNTRAWARWIHEHMPEAQGLYWMSRRDDENSCMVLFGTRIKASVFATSSRPLSAFKLELFEALDAMGAIGI